MKRGCMLETYTFFLPVGVFFGCLMILIAFIQLIGLIFEPDVSSFILYNRKERFTFLINPSTDLLSFLIYI
jgi:hypothetical protein